MRKHITVEPRDMGGISRFWPVSVPYGNCEWNKIAERIEKVYDYSITRCYRRKG